MSKPKVFAVTRTPKDISNNWAIDPKYIADNFCATINVSDSPCGTFDLQRMGIPAFWFPINEIGVWGHAPFFGTLKVVNQYYKGDKPVHIHCHAGANRSPSVAFAILRAMGYTAEEAEESINYPDFEESFQRNIERKHVPKNIVEFLKASMESPEITSLAMTLRKLDALYDEMAQKRFDEQNDYTIKADGESAARLVYNKEKKRFVLVK